MRPQGLCLPIISMASRLQLNTDGEIRAITISMGPVGPVPWIAAPAMELLRGQRPSAARFAEAADAVLGEVALRTSKYRATRDYRETMIRTYLPIILGRAVERAGAVR